MEAKNFYSLQTGEEGTLVVWFLPSNGLRIKEPILYILIWVRKPRNQKHQYLRVAERIHPSSAFLFYSAFLF